MSDLNYRDKDNQPIDFNAWQQLKYSEVESVSIVEYNGKNITVSKKYFGLIGSVFKVWVDASSDTLKYHGYLKHYEGDTEATNDYLRIVEAIEEDAPIFDAQIDNGLYSIIFDAKWNQHIVLDCSNYPEVDTCFNTRAEAEVFFNNLIGE
jgi:hypothetical protein